MAVMLIMSLWATAAPSTRVQATTYTPMVAAGNSLTVGLKSDGKVVAIGDDNYFGQCNVSGWNLGATAPKELYL